jgi:SAM-dependent methyltransferase
MPALSPVQLGSDLRASATVFIASGDRSLAVGAFRQRHASRKAFDGFVAANPLRAWEYAWVIQQIAKHGTGYGEAVDFGAGKSPIPILLADLGYATSVVDSDQLDNEYANEWQWVDYGKWGIKTHKAGMEDRIFDEAALSVAVSVSAIEHMAAETRRKAIEEITRAIKPQGLAVLTIDVMPDGIHLWNLVVDEIEPLGDHGTIDSFVSELEVGGLRLLRRASCPLKGGQSLVEAFVLFKS